MSSVKHTYLSLLTIVAICVTAAYLISLTYQIQFIGGAVHLNPSGEYVVSEITGMGWAAENGMKTGDVITSINDNPPHKHPPIMKYNVIENINTIEWIRDHKRFSYNVSSESIPEILIYHTILPVVNFIFFVLLSSFLFYKKKRDSSIPTLILLFIAIGLSYLSTGGSARGDSIARIVNSASFLLVPVLFIHFLIYYFQRFNIRLISKRVIYGLYALNGSVVLVNFFFIIGKFGTLFPFIRAAQLAAFSFSILMVALIILFGWMRYKTTIYEPIFKLFILCLLIVFSPFVGLVAIPKVLFNVMLLSPETAASFSLLLPIFFIYLVTANRLMDIDFVINRLRYYFFLSFLPTAITLLFIYIINDHNTWIEWIQYLFIVMLSMMAALYMKDEFDFRIGPFRKKPFERKGKFQVDLDQFAFDIGKVTNISALEDRLIEEVKKMLPIQVCTVFSINKHTFMLSIKNTFLELTPKSIIEGLKKKKSNISIGTYIDLDDGMIVVIGENVQEYHFLWVGIKDNQLDFNQNEKTWLKTLAHYVGIVYENLQLTNEMIQQLQESMEGRQKSPSWVLRLLFSLSEKERRNLGADLHDSALQDQLLWYRRLEMALSDPEMPTAVKEELGEIKEGLLDVIHQIRETCNELRPPLLTEKGLADALQDLFEIVQLRSNYIIYYQSEIKNKINDECTLAIYRIMQELLTNATKHSQATQVKIMLKANDQTFQLRYKDNGVGMDLEGLNFSYKHMGVGGMRGRVSSFDGDIMFDSLPGEGLSVFISIPITKKMDLKEVVLKGG